MAGNYTPGRGLHPVVLLSGSGEVNPLSDSLPVEWKPSEISEAELVACIDDGQPRKIETCEYIGGNIVRYKRLASIRLFEAQTGHVVGTVRLQGNQPRSCRSTEPIYLTSLTGDPVSIGQVTQWLANYAEGNILAVLEGHTGFVMSVAWSPDAAKVAAGSRDKTVIIWEPTTGERLHMLEGHSNWVNSVAWSPDSAKIASGSRDNLLIIWDPTTGGQLNTILGHSSSVTRIAWSPDGGKVASVSYDDKVAIWDVAP